MIAVSVGIHKPQMAPNKQLPTELRDHDYTEYDERPKTAQAKGTDLV